MQKKIVLPIILNLMFWFGLNAQIINIPADYSSIQLGINAASDGDTILVQPGIYFEQINYNGKNIVIGSKYLITSDTAYISQTIIDGNNYGLPVVRIMNNETDQAKLIGLTIQHGFTGSDAYGAGVHIAGTSPYLDHLIIRDNNSQSGRGGGIHCYYAPSPIIKNTKFINNICNELGGGLYCFASNPTVINCTFSGNQADGAAVYLYSANGTFINCLMYGNTYNSIDGATYKTHAGWDNQLINCVITNNNTQNGLYLDGGKTKMINTIISGHSKYNINVANGGPLYLDNSIIENGKDSVYATFPFMLQWGTNNISSNPNFIDPIHNDYRLADSSPGIGSGIDSLVMADIKLYAPDYDINNNTRPEPIGSNVDIGCYENSNGSAEKSITISNISISEGQSIEVPILVSKLNVTDNIISYQFDVAYDNTVLGYTGNSVVGTLASGGTVNVNASISGKLSIGYINDTAIIGEGVILKLQFNTLKADTTVLSISNAYLNNISIQNLTNGTIVVKDVTPPTVTIAYNDVDIRCADVLKISANFSEPMDAGNLVKLSLSGAASLIDADMIRQSPTVYNYSYSVPKADGVVNVSLGNGTDLCGNVVVSTPTSGNTFTIIKLNYGDVDDDGKILAYDAALTLQRSVGLDPIPLIDPIPWEKWRDTTANVDGNYGIEAYDAGLILQYSIGLITTFPADGKKSFTSNSIADVTVEIVNNDIVFYSSGDLMGLNISTTNTNQILGTPSVLAPNFLSAFNISGTTFKVGICTANSPSDGVALLKIPYTKSGSVTFTMNINAEQKTVTVDLVTGMVEFSDDNILIYPNPVRDNLKVSGITSPTIARIYNTNGKLLITNKLTKSISEMNVSNLPTGVYIIKLQNDKELAVKRISKK
jgi:hypothetical protein